MNVFTSRVRKCLFPRFISNRLQSFRLFFFELFTNFLKCIRFLDNDQVKPNYVIKDTNHSYFKGLNLVHAFVTGFDIMDSWARAKRELVHRVAIFKFILAKYDFDLSARDLWHGHYGDLPVHDMGIKRPYDTVYNLLPEHLKCPLSRIISIMPFPANDCYLFPGSPDDDDFKDTVCADIVRAMLAKGAVEEKIGEQNFRVFSEMRGQILVYRPLKI